MHRISPNNPVRRCLFPVEDVSDQARVENFTNILQESAEREKIEKMRKWNFDFENEIPLEGVYEWIPCGAHDWLGIQTEGFTSVTDIETTEDTLLPIKFENELTPRSNKDECVPLLRKRRKEVVDNKTVDRSVKRKISFD